MPRRYRPGPGTGIRRDEQSIQLEVDAFPEIVQGGLELKFRAGRLQSKVGRAVASVVRKSIRSGTTPSGEQLPRGDDGKRAFRDTGELIRSVKYKGGRVAAQGNHSKAKISNAGIMGTLVHGLHRDRNRTDRGISPFEHDAPAVVRAASEAADAEMKRQVATGQAKLVTGGSAGSRRGRRTGPVGRRKR